MNERMYIYLSSTYSYVIGFFLYSVVPQNTHTWDLAVANEDGINLFHMNGRIDSSPESKYHLNEFYVLAYDYFHDRIFFSVNDHNISIFTFDVIGKTVTPLVPRHSYDVQGIVYDAAAETLFWTDGNGNSIWRRSLGNESSPLETVILKFENEIPTGITFSYCKRLLFWANSNHLSASIDASDMDGRNHKKLITEDIFLPLAVTVDDIHEKLYWTDDMKGIYYKIERCDFDGTGREVVTRGTNQEPFGIAASRGAIFWTDTIQKNVWMLQLNGSFSNRDTREHPEPEVFHKFNRLSPYGIAALKELFSECDSQAEIASFKTAFSSEEILLIKPENASQYSALEEGAASNDGGNQFVLPEEQPREPSACYRYCLNGGQCFVNGKGISECECSAGYEGVRCEKDVCASFCLNGGECSMKGSNPTCSCGTKYSGQRCEIPLDLVCHSICSDSLENKMFDCISRFKCVSGLTESKNSSMNSMQSVTTSQCQQQNIMTILLVCFLILAMLVIAVLLRKICVLRRRPRIKKRIIVNKGVRSQTPMTARPQLHSSEQCEITIENCCNMSICETPCFEPNLRPPLPSPISEKTDDKKKLLKNMEEEFGSSNRLYS